MLKGQPCPQAFLGDKEAVKFADWCAARASLAVPRAQDSPGPELACCAGCSSTWRRTAQRMQGSRQ